MACHHRHKVNETRKRSLTKTISFRIIEIIVDVFILLGLMKTGMPELMIAGVGAISVEATCGVGYYIWERLWNRISWGRIIEDI